MSEPKKDVSVRFTIEMRAPKLEDLVRSMLAGDPVSVGGKLVVDGDSLEAALKTLKDNTSIWDLIF